MQTYLHVQDYTVQSSIRARLARGKVVRPERGSKKDVKNGNKRSSSCPCPRVPSARQLQRGQVTETEKEKGQKSEARCWLARVKEGHFGRVLPGPRQTGLSGSQRRNEHKREPCAMMLYAPDCWARASPLDPLHSLQIYRHICVVAAAVWSAVSAERY